MELIKIKKFIICIAIPLAIGGLAALITKDSFALFNSLNKPPLSPPGILFPIVWTTLYVLMGIASFLILKENKDCAKAILLYGSQLLVNFLWPILFFNFKLYLVSSIWIVLLLILVILTTIEFYKIKKLAGYLLVPYIVWVAFATYLNVAIFILN